MGLLDLFRSQPRTANQQSEPKDERKAECPNCHKALSKIPSAKTKCPHCGENMFVRTRPKDNARVVVTKAEADKAFDLFIRTFETKYASAVECLRKDRDALLTFYDFPADNWCHIRTTNPIESTFATILLRHRKTKNNGSAKASTVMIFKLAQSAAKGWRKLRGHTHLKDLLQGVRFIDGENEHKLNEKKRQRSSENNSSKETAA